MYFFRMYGHNVAVLILTLLTIADSSATLYAPSRLWNKSQIKVCFYDDPIQIEQTVYSTDPIKMRIQGFMPGMFSKGRKRRMQRHIEKTYSALETGIHFVGWKSCSMEPDFDVIIIQGKNIPAYGEYPKVPFELRGKSTLGDGIDGDNPLITDRAAVILRDSLHFTWSHEFGHLAGLHHGHLYPELAEDEFSCTGFKNSPNGKESVFFDPRAEYLAELQQVSITLEDMGGYDNQSIMSYCTPNRRKKEAYRYYGPGELSVQDKTSLKRLYSER